MEQLLQQHLIRVQQRQKAQADKNRTERQFQVGQMVFVKLQPYVQTSVAQRINQKLSFRYFGPFPVIQRIGQVAYKLQLPPTSAIHPVFHVSQLKLAIGPGHPVSSELPDSTSSSQYPVKILQRRRKRHNAQLIDQILVQWSSWPKHLTTWEDEITLKATFPRAPAWGQAGSQGGRNVTTSAASDVVPGEETTEADEVVELSKGPGVKTRPKRTVKPNMKYIGPSWTNPSSKKAEA
jgi:ribosomal protein L21E